MHTAIKAIGRHAERIDRNEKFEMKRTTSERTIKNRYTAGAVLVHF